MLEAIISFSIVGVFCGAALWVLMARKSSKPSGTPSGRNTDADKV